MDGNGQMAAIPAKLQEAIAEKLRRENGLAIAADQVAVAFGTKNAFYNTCLAVLDPGDRVLIPSPHWVSYPEIVRLAGGKPVLIGTKAEDGFKLTAGQLREAGPGAKALVLNQPHNPTGAVYSANELAELAEEALRAGLIVFSDEVCEKLAYADAPFVSMGSVNERMGKRTITFGGPSKAMAMAGWRLGWLAGPVGVASAVRAIMSHASSYVPLFVQAAALAACDCPRVMEAIQAIRRRCEANGREATQRLNALPGIRCIKPAGGMYCFPNVSGRYGGTIGAMRVDDSASFARALVRAAGVAVVPGAVFGGDECVRLSLSAPRALMDEALTRLERHLAA
jgi:aspartate aminotransferase